MSNLRSRLAIMLMGFLFLLGSAPTTAASYGEPELEQLVAPIALYPDPLLSQVLMAATYPVEVVEAARWRASQPKRLSDQQLAQRLLDQPWDPSVKSLAAFPDILSMMNDNISWTNQLGEAFLDQQDEVMDAVQRLRARAQAAGNLQSTSQQVVNASDNPAIITILPAQPDAVYVPFYNPTVVYGTWPYPDYRPYYWRPPGYAISGPTITFAGALIVGGVLWSTYDWHHHHFNVDINRYNRFNRTRITSERWHRNFDQRRVAADRNAASRRNMDNQRRDALQAPGREQYNPGRRDRFSPNADENRNRNSGHAGRGNENSAPRFNNRAENPTRPQPQKEIRTPPQVQSARQPSGAPRHQSGQQSRSTDQPRARAQAQPAAQIRSSRPMRPQESPRSPNMERRENMPRPPRETMGVSQGRSYGNRGGGRPEAGRSPEQRQAPSQERRGPRDENSGGRGKRP